MTISRKDGKRAAFSDVKDADINNLSENVSRFLSKKFGESIQLPEEFCNVDKFNFYIDIRGKVILVVGVLHVVGDFAEIEL